MNIEQLSPDIHGIASRFKSRTRQAHTTVVQTDEWKKELESSLQEFVYLASSAALKYCDEQNLQIGAALAGIQVFGARLSCL